MSIPKQSSIWDDKRNTSRVRPAPPGSVEAAVRASAAYMRQYPKHARWLLDGHPSMTHEQHYARFEQAYKRGELS